MQIPYRTRKQALGRKLLAVGFIIILGLPLLVYKFSKSAQMQAALQQKAEPGGAVKSPASSPQENLPRLSKVNNVRYWITDEYTRVVLDLNDAVKFEKRRADKGVFHFDLLGAQLGPHLDGKVLPVDDSPLRGVHLVQHTSDRVRVSLDLTSKAEYTIFSLQNPYRIVIDIRGPKVKSKLAASRPDKSAAPETVETIPDQVKDKAITKDKLVPYESATNVSSKGATVAEPAKDRKEVLPLPMNARPIQQAVPSGTGPMSLIRTLGLKISKIVIDPGHGGWDMGTVGKTGLKEKDVALDVARKLGKMLEERLGAQVILTRTDDRFIALEERTTMANAHAADLFISIHVNASKNRSARGIETYFLSLTVTGEDAREVVARENASAQKSIHELEDLVKKITLTEKINESKEFASIVQQNLFKGLSAYLPKTSNRGVKLAPFIVLIGAKMPSILAEIAFLSNLTDEKFLQQESSREKIADSIYRGIETYMKTLGDSHLALKEKGK